MHRAIAAIAFSAAATAALAQSGQLTYTATVVGVSTDNPDAGLEGVEVGDVAQGLISFDLTVDPDSTPIASFPIDGISLAVGDFVFQAQSPGGFSLNDTAFAFNGESISPDGLVDGLIVGGELSDLDNGTGNLTAGLFGETTWFEAGQLPGTASLGFENLYRAGITIEFTRVENIFDENGNLNPPSEWVEITSGIEVELNAISSNGGTVATIGCGSCQIASPVAVADLSDVQGFISAFLAGDTIADLDENGAFDLNDVSEFVTSFVAAGG